MITPQDEAAYWRWMLNPSMKLTEAFAAYREEIENFYIEGGAGEYGTYSCSSGDDSRDQSL